MGQTALSLNLWFTGLEYHGYTNSNALKEIGSKTEEKKLYLKQYVEFQMKKMKYYIVVINLCIEKKCK